MLYLTTDPYLIAVFTTILSVLLTKLTYVIIEAREAVIGHGLPWVDIKLAVVRLVVIPVIYAGAALFSVMILDVASVAISLIYGYIAARFYLETSVTKPNTITIKRYVSLDVVRKIGCFVAESEDGFNGGRSTTTYAVYYNEPRVIRVNSVSYPSFCTSDWGLSRSRFLPTTLGSKLID